MIDEFHVSNYKCLVDIRLPLTPIHVIIGQNDSGKTSLLEAMLILSRSIDRQISQAFPGEWQGRELVYAGSNEPVISFEASFDGSPVEPGSRLTYHLEVEFLERETCRRVDEWLENDGRSPIPELGTGWTGVAQRRNQPRLDSRLKDRIESMVSQIAPAALYRFEPKVMAIPASIDPNRKFRMDPDGFGLATLLDDILGFDAERFLDLRRDFCEFFPEFRSVRIESTNALKRDFSEQGRHHTATSAGKGIFFETSHGQSIRAQQASDGALLFLSLLALIYSPQPPSLLLIEEPEKGVYPKRLDAVVNLIRKLQEAPSGRRIPQIVMTTHSPYLLTSFQPDEVTLMVRRDGHGPVAARPLRNAPHIEARLGRGEFYLGELWYNLSEDELFANAEA